ncbi:multidrug efflux SMR transporter [Halobacillus sp. A1]|uniref:DMT family transporter n=1 Tax=Halobacillus sp. A1 TaxID=2880262 RepID=UPI0020A641F0|nr:multidrug efflux SMR transporter [Halobacillus sp. A1]MCP3033037.1 multidrug efflux SMR transporter [Halobacillus sp. A1]
MNAYFLLAIAIVCEVIGNAMLKASNGFKILLPSLGVVVSFGVAFYALSLTLRAMPIGVTYAIWAGAGTALTTLLGITIYKENINTGKLLGLVLIIGGIVLLNIESTL